MRYVEVITSLPIDRTFQYLVPENASFEPAAGKRVYVPFRSAKRVGYIVEVEDEPKVDNPRPLIDVIDEEPVFTGEMIELARWMKDYYLCSWGEALEAMVPGVLKRGKVSSRPRVKEEEERISAQAKHVPNSEQKEVLDEINKCLDEKKHKVFLLHGITGSGKTEIYLQAAESVLARGRSAVILVPEISLTPQTVERFVSRFGDRVAVFHSKMLESVRFLEWKRIKLGEADIVVGPRSAVFSPFRNVGLFVIDEEHEPSYKQEDVPRYHAREVAIKRAEMSSSPVILGSATPSLESYYKSLRGEYKLVELTQRIDERKLPRVRVVDMRMNFETRTGREVVSPVLAEALRKDIKERKQALIFLNRRGFSTYVSCRKCGFTMKCPRCDSTLVFHKERNELICHYCNGRLEPPRICPSCKGDYLLYMGTGTQKVEDELKRMIPALRIARMDSDSMSKRGAHASVLRDFRDHKVDIIVGTQMIAKGLDFPKVTQVGVISADANLNLPDFRAGERTFNLITQVAGRAGRGDLGGEVIVQTYTPEHYAILFASKHDYRGFYAKEIESREGLGFPPFANLIKITIRSRKEENAAASSSTLAENILSEIKDVEIMGPAPSPMARLRGFYRWNIMIKTRNVAGTAAKLRRVLEKFHRTGGVFVAVDVDPMSM